MRGLLSVIGSGVAPMIAVGVFWAVINNMHRVNGVGLLTRQGWPLADVWTMVGVAGFLGMVAGLGRMISNRRRAAAAAKVAEEMGFTFSADVSAEDLKPFASLPALKRRNWAGNRMTSRGEGQSVSVLDVISREGTGDDVQSLDRTLVLLPGAGEGFPELDLRPRSIGVRMLAGLGLEGVTFAEEGLGPVDAEVVCEFGRHYHLSAGIDRLVELVGSPGAPADSSIR